VAAWVAFFESGVDPVVAGLAMGLLAVAYPAARSDLEQASESFRLFREQPVPEGWPPTRGRACGWRSRRTTGCSSCSISLDELPDRAVVRPGERWDHGQRSFLARACTSPVTLGILLGYVAGKPAGTAGRPGCWPASAAVRSARRSAGRR